MYSYKSFRKPLVFATSFFAIAALSVTGGLALWSDTASAPAPGSITAGSLGVKALGSGQWKEGSNNIDLASFYARPGTSLVFEQGVDIKTVGTNLVSHLEVTPPTLPSGLTGEWALTKVGESDSFKPVGNVKVVLGDVGKYAAFDDTADYVYG